MLQQLRNVNFGKTFSNATGSLGVGYSLLDISGSVVSPRTTSGVYQLTSGSGLYAAYISFPDEFRGQIMWDTGTVYSSVGYAVEQYNVEENNPIVRETHNVVTTIQDSVEIIRQFTEGRWKIENNQMLFYDKDNVTLIATFDLFDAFGVPTEDAVFERVRT